MKEAGLKTESLLRADAQLPSAGPWHKHPEPARRTHAIEIKSHVAFYSLATVSTNTSRPPPHLPQYPWVVERA